MSSSLLAHSSSLIMPVVAIWLHCYSEGTESSPETEREREVKTERVERWRWKVLRLAANPFRQPFQIGQQSSTAQSPLIWRRGPESQSLSLEIQRGKRKREDRESVLDSSLLLLAHDDTGCSTQWFVFVVRVMVFVSAFSFFFMRTPRGFPCVLCFIHSSGVSPFYAVGGRGEGGGRG